MRYTIPHYYSRFRCIAGKCPDTCCAGWQIMIDDKTLEKYAKAKGPFAGRLYNSVDWKEKCLKQYNRKCAFLNEEGLCDLQTEAGAGMLCKTCRNYPRHIEEFENVREITLSLSCPEVARIVLTCEEPAKFISKEDKKEEYEETFDDLLYDKLLDAREVLIRILQDRDYPMRTRLAMILAFGHDLQSRIDRHAVFRTDQLLARYQMPDAMEKMERKIKDISFSKETLKAMFAVLEELEALDPKWPDFVKRTKEVLYPGGKKEKKQNTEEESAQNRREFQKIMEQQYGPVRFDIQCEQIAVYFIVTYFCGAVYDGDAYTKIKFAVMNTIWIREMVKAEWQKEKCVPGFETAARIVWRFSKEIEHSDQNIRNLERVLSGNKIFDLENILKVL